MDTTLGYACYPEAEIQKHIVHQIRNSIRYVSYKDVKKIAAALRKVTREEVFSRVMKRYLKSISGDSRCDVKMVDRPNPKGQILLELSIFFPDKVKPYLP